MRTFRPSSGTYILTWLRKTYSSFHILHSYPFVLQYSTMREHTRTIVIIAEACGVAIKRPCPFFEERGHAWGLTAFMITVDLAQRVRCI